MDKRGNIWDNDTGAAMKILIVIENEKLVSVVEEALAAEGHQLIFSADPVDVMKNMSETPDCIIFNFEDFPYHWKPVWQFFRCDLILLTGRTFTLRDRAEAAFLGITAQIPWNVEVKTFTEYLKKAVQKTR